MTVRCAIGRIPRLGVTLTYGPATLAKCASSRSSGIASGGPETGSVVLESGSVVPGSALGRFVSNMNLMLVFGSDILRGGRFRGSAG